MSDCIGHRGKVRFASWSQAEKTVKRMMRVHDEPYQVYRCRCGGIYIGRAYFDKAKVRKPYARKARRNRPRDAG